MRITHSDQGAVQKALERLVSAAAAELRVPQTTAVLALQEPFHAILLELAKQLKE